MRGRGGCVAASEAAEAGGGNGSGTGEGGGGVCANEAVEEQRGDDAHGEVVVFAAESSGVRVGEEAHVSVRREGGRGRGRPCVEGEEDTRASGKRRKYSTLRWGAVARESYQQAQQGSRGVRFERGEGGGVT